MTYYCTAETSLGIDVEYVVHTTSFHDAKLEFENAKCADDRLIKIEVRHGGFVERHQFLGDTND